MGASASKVDKGADSVVSEQLDITRSMLNKLEDIPATDVPAPGPERQGELDSTIHQKIRAELAKLRKQEADVQKQIELALEKENIERAGKPWFGKDKGQSSVLLEQELNALRSKIGKYSQLPSISSFAGLQEARDAVVKCYRDQPTRTLDCWKEVEEFKKASAAAEKELMAKWT
ncbi:hypothetical protein MCUN1_002309 [Malassezia cuniculi]|uniref:MICOS complex subunit mic19 n=1 Tax=Malassezia cuniculi TaxID=948313 RepID=A0AAF0ERT9_9BASI|nr:hypothetical protein MCUN1_002309 [Malassezia cuniculi]